MKIIKLDRDRVIGGIQRVKGQIVSVPDNYPHGDVIRRPEHFKRLKDEEEKKLKEKEKKDK